MVARRQGLLALALGIVLSLGVHAIPASPPCPAGDCQLPAPEGFRGLGSDDTRLKVAWKTVPGAFAYRLELATNPHFATDRVLGKPRRETVSGGPTVIKNLPPGTTLYLRVASLDRDLRQQSAWSGALTEATKGAMTVSVGTYNIHNPDDSWPKRGPWVADGIVGQQVQLVGVQEAYRASERQSLLDLVNIKSQEINGNPVFEMAPEATNPAGYDNRILYDTRVVELVASGAKPYDHQVGGDEVDRWFSWGVFRHRSSGWRILFVTTHLAPGDDEADQRQWDELIGRVNSLKRTYRAHWVVVSGDFNTTKFEKPADVMLPAMQANGYGDVLGSTFRSYDTSGARAQVREDTWLNSFNGFERDIDDYDVDKDDNGNSVDWIFASNELEVPFYRVHARYDGDELEKPIPSDHFLVWATLAYQPSRPAQPVISPDASVAPSS